MFWSPLVGLVAAGLMFVIPGLKSALAVVSLSFGVFAAIWVGTNLPDVICNSDMCRRGAGLYDLVRVAVVGGSASLVAAAACWRLLSRLRERRDAARADAFWRDAG